VPNVPNFKLAKHMQFQEIYNAEKSFLCFKAEFKSHYAKIIHARLSEVVME